MPQHGLRYSHHNSKRSNLKMQAYLAELKSKINNFPFSIYRSRAINTPSMNSPANSRIMPITR